MIAGLAPALPDIFAALLWSAICFVGGVAYAAYRAVGWVESWRQWAHGLEIDTLKEEPK